MILLFLLPSHFFLHLKLLLLHLPISLSVSPPPALCQVTVEDAGNYMCQINTDPMTFMVSSEL